MAVTLAPYATLDDIATRYPRELTVMAADETTGIRDDARINAVIADVTAEIRSILVQRYRRDELARLDADSLELMRSYAIPMALYKVALSFSRSSERVQAGYDGAVTALRAIAKGSGALTFDPDPDTAKSSADPAVAVVDNTAVIFESNERLFTRTRTRGL